MNAIQTLRQDHEKVQKLFEDFRRADRSARGLIAYTICDELELHARLEEEIFYPAVRAAASDEEGEAVVDEAIDDHRAAESLIRELRQLDSGASEFDAKVQLLQTVIEQHVEEEETEIFPGAEEALVDELDAIGRDLVRRKRELQSVVQREYRAH